MPRVRTGTETQLRSYLLYGAILVDMVTIALNGGMTTGRVVQQELSS